MTKRTMSMHPLDSCGIPASLVGQGELDDNLIHTALRKSASSRHVATTKYLASSQCQQ